MGPSPREIIVIESSDDEQPVTTSQESSSTKSATSGSLGRKQKASIKRSASVEVIEIDGDFTGKKHRASAPLRYIDPSIHFTTAQRAPAAHNVDCVTLESLVGDPDLEIIVQINYMIEIDFFMEKVHESIRDVLRIIVYHGLRTMEQHQDLEAIARAKYPNVTVYHVPVPGFGTHHTKAMLLFYRDNTMQVVVHTANIIERDWRNKTQAVFTTGRLKKKDQPSENPTCAFEHDLLEYLQNYNNHLVMTSRVSQYDFTGIRGVLIGSVPGRFSGSDKNKWGHMRLRSVLKQQVEIPKEYKQGSKIICQMSSIGSLGKDAEDWLRGEFESSLNAHRNSNYLASSKADLCVVYPTAENVRTSYDGWAMGWSLPFRSTSYNKQAHYLDPLLHSWKAIKSGRERAMPHIKTFTRVTSKAEGDYLSWFLLTSANLSKPAWGETHRDGAFSIQSYELGVLLFPELFENIGETGENFQVYMMNTTLMNPYPEPQSFISALSNERESASNDSDDHLEGNIGVVRIRLPYDLPLQKYDLEVDHVWLADKFFPGVDDFGKTLQR
ncbi:MAG: tyrosyl-DNA phosphodiesterase I [Benniella sp.]|nr:MAG: tyrosyl-DNA phosphodiesterase I [Benniella sp.]